MSVNFKKQIHSENAELLVSKLEAELKKIGFGVLTRIDFNKKLKEKLNVDLPTEIILGVCDPKLAYAVYLKDTDVTSLMPCNAVIREIAPQKFSVEITKPTAIVKTLQKPELIDLVVDGDKRIEAMLENF
jgi:uncharacterized protein (DUF302 family)